MFSQLGKVSPLYVNGVDNAFTIRDVSPSCQRCCHGFQPVVETVLTVWVNMRCGHMRSTGGWDGDHALSPKHGRFVMLRFMHTCMKKERHPQMAGVHPVGHQSVVQRNCTGLSMLCNAFALFSVGLIVLPAYGWFHPGLLFGFHCFWFILFFYVNSAKTRILIAACRQPVCTRGAPLRCATHCTMLLLVDISTSLWMGHPCTDDKVIFYFFPFALFWLSVPPMIQEGLRMVQWGWLLLNWSPLS